MSKVKTLTPKRIAQQAARGWFPYENGGYDPNKFRENIAEISRILGASCYEAKFYIDRWFIARVSD